MAKKSSQSSEPRVSDIVWRDRPDGKVDKVWLNGKKVVKSEVFDQR